MPGLCDVQDAKAKEKAAKKAKAAAKAAKAAAPKDVDSKKAKAKKEAEEKTVRQTRQCCSARIHLCTDEQATVLCVVSGTDYPADSYLLSSLCPGCGGTGCAANDRCGTGNAQGPEEGLCCRDAQGL